MSEKSFSSETGQSNQALQDTLDHSEPTIAASYALVGSVLLLGGIGFAVDRWAGTSPWFLLLGLLGGILLGLVNLAVRVRRH